MTEVGGSLNGSDDLTSSSSGGRRSLYSYLFKTHTCRGKTLGSVSEGKPYPKEYGR